MARPQKTLTLIRLIPFAGLILLTGTANASQQPSGINAIYYQIIETPPIRSDDVYESCGLETENNINRSFDGEPFAGCPNDLFMVHYTGSIVIPAHTTIQFWLAADDGGTMKIDGFEWGGWVDQGCSAYETPELQLASGIPLQLDGWFYENGGGTCFMLAWNLDGQGWEIVPDDAFTQLPVVLPPVITEPATTTTEATTTTTSTSTTSTTQPATTTTAKSTTTTEATTTSSSVVPETTTTHQLQVQTTLPDPAPVAVTTTNLLQPMPVATSLASTSLPAATTTTTNAPQVSLPTSLPIQEQPLQTPSITDNKIIELLADIKTASPTQISMAVEAIIDTGITADQATELATTPEVLKNVTSEQATTIFESLDLGTLETTQLETLIAVVQNAPDAVRESFETAINVFDGVTDTYVPLGSSVPISTRRLVIAAGAMMAAIPIPTRKQ